MRINATFEALFIHTPVLKAIEYENVRLIGAYGLLWVCYFFGDTGKRLDRSTGTQGHPELQLALNNN
jgi:hypothetical protein